MGVNITSVTGEVVTDAIATKEGGQGKAQFSEVPFPAAANCKCALSQLRSGRKQLLP